VPAPARKPEAQPSSNSLTKSNRPGRRSRLQPLGLNDRADSGIGAVEIVIDDDIVIFAPVLDFRSGIGEPLLDDIIGIFGTAMQPCPEFLHRGRQDEDRDHVGAHLVLELLSTLPIDVKEHVAALGHG
jgi:hypothetical protein